MSGTSFGSNIIVGSYQDGTHVSDSNDVQKDLAASVNNTKYLTASTVSINGGGSVNLNTVTSGTAPFLFRFTHGSSVATTGAAFYAYDGVTDATPMSGITFQAAEVGDTNWAAANGSGAALSLDNQGSATQHDFWLVLSATPLSTGAKVGSVKLTLTYA